MAWQLQKITLPNGSVIEVLASSCHKDITIWINHKVILRLSRDEAKQLASIFQEQARYLEDSKPSVQIDPFSHPEEQS